MRVHASGLGDGGRTRDTVRVVTWEVETMIYGGRGLCTCLCHSTCSWEGAVAVRQWPWISIPLYHNVSNKTPVHLYRLRLLTPSYYICTRHCTPVGVGKRGRKETPFAKALFSHREHSVLCTRGIAANAHHLYSDHRGACDEKKMSGLKIKHALGFQLHVTFISD
jgi:hypothetical protein